MTDQEEQEFNEALQEHAKKIQQDYCLDSVVIITTHFSPNTGTTRHSARFGNWYAIVASLEKTLFGYKSEDQR